MKQLQFIFILLSASSAFAQVDSQSISMSFSQVAAVDTSAISSAISYTASACIPIQVGQISFHATGITLSASEITAGFLPEISLFPGPHGMVSLGGEFTGTVSPGFSRNFGLGGSLRLNVEENNVMSGLIVFDIHTLAQLLSAANPDSNDAAGLSPCITSLAINAVYTPLYGAEISHLSGVIHQAAVYVTFNNGKTTVVYFF